MIEGLDDMTDAERRDAIWGLRDGCAPHMNRIRRESFESIKALLVDRCARPSKIKPPPANVIQIRTHSQLQNLANAKLIGHILHNAGLGGRWIP